MGRPDTKTEIVTTAISLFNERGSAAVSTNHIADAMGISPGNLYYHFRNKKEIIKAIFQRMVRDMDSVWGTTHDTTPSLKLFFNAMNSIQMLLSNYRFFQRELSSLLRNDEELALAYRKVRQARQIEIEGFFDYLIRTGVMRRPEDPKSLHRLIQIGWLIADYWFDYLDIEGEIVNENNVRTGVDLVIEILRPYLNEPIR